MRWYYYLSLVLAGGVLAGRVLLKVIDYLIAWVHERREQRREMTTHEKDRPRPRVDVSILETSHPHRKTIVVKILSLGALPITINYGDATIYSSQYQEPIINRQFSRKEITPAHPIEVELPIKLNILHPSGIGDVEVKLVCKFSYGENESQTEEQYYNRNTQRFETVDILH